MKNLKDKTVLITGSGSGIGRLLALHFASEGSIVVLWDINKESIDKTANEIKKAGGTALAYKCDVSDRNTVYRTAEKVRKDIGEVRILINNAGIVSGKPFLECTDKQVQKTMDINIIAHFWTTKAFLPAMIKANNGHLVTISSAGGLIGTASLADYCASKFAAFGFNESIRMELKKQKLKGVKTTCVCPFFINTGMFEGVKSRFEFLLPIFDEKKAALKIFKAIKRNKPVLKMPWIVNTIPLFRLMPVRLMDSIVAFLGLTSSMDEFRGRQNRQKK